MPWTKAAAEFAATAAKTPYWRQFEFAASEDRCRQRAVSAAKGEAAASAVAIDAVAAAAVVVVVALVAALAVHSVAWKHLGDEARRSTVGAACSDSARARVFVSLADLGFGAVKTRR